MIKEVSGLFNEGFREVNEYSGRYRVLMGGAGSGKSTNVAMDYLLKLLDSENQGANLLVIRKTEESNRNSTFAEIMAAAKRVFGKDYVQYIQARNDPMSIYCKSTGNEVIFRGMKDNAQKEKIKSIQARSGKICWVWCEESTELEAADFELIDDRLRGELSDNLYYQITLTFNPISHYHWLKKRFFETVDDEAMVHTSTFEDNAFIDEGFAKRMQGRKERDPEGYRIYALGEWGESGGGRILNRFSFASLDSDEKYYDQMAMGMDFGYNHPTVVLLCGIRGGDIYVLKEMVCVEMDGEEIAAEMNKAFEKDVILWCDSAEPDRIKRLRTLGWKARGVKKGAGSVSAQIDYLQARGIAVDFSCEKLSSELREWSWKYDSRSGEYLDEPREGNDDAVAALRYAIEGWRQGAKVGFD